MKYSVILTGLLLVLFPAFASAATCDQTFEGTLRVGHSYRFNDTLANEAGTPIQVINFFPEFNEKYDYNGSSAPINYAWTPWILSRNGVVQSGEAGIIAETDSSYPVIFSPPVRAKDNLTVRYVVEYSPIVNGVQSSIVESHSECKSYEITWCGDGVVDSKYNEVCDLGAQNGKPGSTCSAKCTVVTEPPLACERGNIALPLTGPITSGSPGLCKAGVPVVGFGSTISGNTTNYFWACGNSAIGGECTATYSATGPACQRGPISLPPTAPLTSASFGLCPSGQTVGDFTAVNVGSGINYTWSCNGSAVGGTCSATYNPANLACTPGPTTGPQTAPLTSASVGLCPAGQTVGGFTATTVGATTNYTWSCNGSQVGGLCAASYTPSAPACVIGTITLPLTTAITATTPNLCPAGQTVNGFTESAPVGGIVTYTWGCNGSAVGGVCTATFAAGGTGICGRLTATPNTSTSGNLTSAMSCIAGTAAGANPTFAISCGNGQTINAATGNCTYTTPGNFVASCVVNGANPTPAACQVPVTVSNGGGGGPGACKSLEIQSNIQVDNGYRVSFVCSANAGTAGPNPSYRVECGNGQAAIGANAGSCFYNKSGTYNIACYVENSTDSTNCQRPVIISSTGAPLPPGGGGSGGGGGGGGGGLCGNGRIDAGETCDAGSNGGMPINNGFCNNCRAAWTNPGACARGALDCPLGWTNPGGNGIDLLYNGAPVSNMRAIVGNDVNPFNPGDVFSIRAEYPIALNGLTAGFVNNSPGGLITGQSLYRSINDACIGRGTMQLGENAPVINCGDYRLFTADQNGAFNGTKFLGNTSSILAGQASTDVNPPTSVGSAVRMNNFFVGLNYLIEPLPVRVARSAVSNTAGGNAYVGSRVGYSVNTITESFLDSLKKGNFTVTSSAKDAAFSLSSNTAEQAGKEIGRNDSQDSSISKFASSASTAADRVVTINSQSDFELSLSKVGDSPDLYTLPKGKIVINADISLSGVKTVVIDQGTLEIRGNITYADPGASWAFVVKQASADGKAIIVTSSVTDIAGVYIVLSGKMVGAGQTANPLAVDGNVNANIADLVNDRTYIRATSASTALSTGVTINYSTRAFKNPPPLLSQYLDQYNLAKIAQ
ncbi:MAG: hypothetical protein ACOYN2_02825 [Patescibacteria group bacterium]